LSSFCTFLHPQQSKHHTMPGLNMESAIVDDTRSKFHPAITIQLTI
jgi:hypothetical protein